MAPFVKRPEHPPGKHLPGDRSCRRCHNLLSDPISLAAIIKSDDGFRYCRNYQELSDSADSGCILCKMIFDHHVQFGPSVVRHGADEEHGSSDIEIINYTDPEVVFSVKAVSVGSNTSATLQRLQIQGEAKGGKPHEWDFSLSVQVSTDSPASLFIPSRPPLLDLTPEATQTWGRKWVDECLLHHPGCNKSLEPFRPTRMLEITDSESTVKLHTSTPAEQDLYVALSYCWGDTQPVQTTKDTIETYNRAIEICTLPQTIKDAISATKALGYKFLWVDALCIVQDDDEDKSREISQMHKIYENAILTISAASARKATDGFLRKFTPATFPVSMFRWRSHDWFTTFELDYRCPDGVTCQVSLTSTFEASPINEPINERAWTLQEALLSPRMLMYGRLGMFWRCTSSFATTHDRITWGLWERNSPLFSLSEPLPVDGIAEESSHSRVIYMYTFGNDLYNVLPASSAAVDKPNLRISTVMKKWMKLVSLYSARQLSNRHDKLPAIGGIAMKIHAETGVEYIAGLWEDSMLAGLSWQRVLSAHPVRRSHTPTFGDHYSWRAPTWSWASIDGPVEYTTYDIHWQSMDPRAHVHHAVAEPRSNSTIFQHLWHAEMHIEGWLREIEIESIPAAVWPNPTGSRREELRFADVFILEPEPAGSQRSIESLRCGSAIMDESIDSVPYSWTHPHGLETVYAMPLFSSRSWIVDGKGHRFHGLLLVKWPVGNYNRIGWFDSFAMNFEDFKKWFAMADHKIIEIY